MGKYLIFRLAWGYGVSSSIDSNFRFLEVSMGFRVLGIEDTVVESSVLKTSVCRRNGFFLIALTWSRNLRFLTLVDGIVDPDCRR